MLLKTLLFQNDIYWVGFSYYNIISVISTQLEYNSQNWVKFKYISEARKNSKFWSEQFEQRQNMCQNIF